MKKFFAVILSITMLLCVLPMQALAAEWTADAPTVSLAASELQDDGGIVVTVTIGQTNSKNISSYGLGVYYDKDVVKIDDTKGSTTIEDDYGDQVAIGGFDISSYNQLSPTGNFSINKTANVDGEYVVAFADMREKGFANNRAEMVFTIYFKVIDTDAAKAVFTLADTGTIMLNGNSVGLYSISDGTDDVAYPTENNSATVALPMKSAIITGELATPTKGNTDNSTLASTNANVDVSIIWDPALTDGKFAASREYTARVIVSPVDGTVFAEDAVVTGGGLTFTRDGENFVATKEFPATAAKSLVSISASEPMKKAYVYGDEFDRSSVTVTGTYDDASSEEITDYTVSYPSGTAFALGHTSVTLRYGDKETVVSDLAVSPRSIADAVITLGTQAVYSGSGQSVVIEKVMLGDTELFQGTDYSITTGGTATNVENVILTITGEGNYQGTKTATWSLTKASPDISYFNLPELTAVTYSGSEVPVSAPTTEKAGMGEITVKYNDRTVLPKAAGRYAVTFDVAEGTNYTAASGLEIGTLDIDRAPVTIIGVGTANKGYDGSTDAEITGNASVSGKFGDDDVTVTVGTASFEDEFAGDVKEVFFSGFALDGDDKDNYFLSAQPASVTASITSVDQNPTITSQKNLVKGGYTLDLSTLVSNAQGEASFMISSGNAATLEGSTLTSGDSEGEVVISVSIAPKDVNGEEPNEFNAYNGTITVSVVNKADAGATVIGGESIGKTYGDEAFTISGAVTNPGTGEGVWTWSSSDESVAAVVAATGEVTILAAGSADITGTYESDTTMGSATATLTINQADNAVTGLSIEDWTFGDTPNAPTATAAFGEIVYTYSDSATDGFDAAVPTDAGTWYVKAEVAGTSNYKGDSAITSFVIGQKEVTVVSGIAVTAKDYDGNTSATLDFSGVVFSDPGVVGTVTAVGTYDNADAGTHVVTLSELTLIESSGNYVLAATGNQTTVENAVINPLVVSLTASIDADSVPYTGTEQKPAVTVTYNSSTLVLDKDYTLAYVGDTTNVTAEGVTVTPAAIGNYEGSSFTPATLSYAITAQDITADTVTMAAIADQTYTGEAILPAVTLTCGSYTLAAGTDYTVALTAAEADNVNVGTVSLTITGLGNFSGSRTASFDIVPAAASGTLTLSASAESIDPGVVLTPGIYDVTLDTEAVTYQWYRVPNGGEAEAIEGAAEYTYTVAEADAFCELYVVVTASGNYTGTLQSNALAVNKLVLNETVTLSLADGVVTATFGGTVDPANYDVAWLRDGATALDAEGAAYTTVYEDKAHSITVTLTGKGVYTGVVTSDPVEIPAEAPYFKSIEVEAGDRKATLKIEVLDNGSPITEYVITATKVGSDEAPITVPVTEFGTSQVVAGLDNENEYSFTVTAKNSVGSTVSDAVKATPFEEDMPDGGGGSYSGGGSSSSSESTSEGETTEPTGDIVVNVKEEQIAEGGIVTLDVQVDTAEKADEAPSITIVLPENSGSVKLEIPVEDLSATSVVVLVKEDGTEEIVPKAAMTEDGLVIETDETVTVKIVDNQKSYKDLADDYWGKEAIDFVTARGLFNGVGDGEFDAVGTMTRAMLVTVLYRLEGQKDVNYQRLFSDVANWTWYSDAITWATQAGIVEGYEDGSFGTDDPVTREQIAVILWRLNGKPEAETDASIATGASDWAEDAMRWAISIGLIQGDGNGYNAKGSATRSEVATLLMRYINLLAQE